MKKFNIGLLLVIAIIFSSCAKKNAEKKNDDKANTEIKKTASYSFSKEGTTVKWVSYKTSEKIAVGGEFKAFTVEGNKEAEKMEDVLMGANFALNINDVASGDESRDKKIKETFFGTMKETAQITGSLKSMNEGKAVISIKMNEMEKDVEFSYKADGDRMDFKAKIDVANWDATGAIDALNKVCELRHKAEDGKSILWSEVDLDLSVAFTKTMK